MCQHWRSVGEALYFGDSNWWQGQATIRHPKQLLTLVSGNLNTSPPLSPGLMKPVAPVPNHVVEGCQSVNAHASKGHAQA